ncbi:toprim domain-containing protein [Sphingobacterium sp. HMA12]|uniref:toprim domain-containing protein n=1 Tax=Sphingobacterium sp. HMA12 TaxID=2050894 RepID=UPI000CEA5D42|nr:toprim domain-containing protein [Sphingobacterium sp. HMA12]
METIRNAKQIKDEVSLVDFLARLGHHPSRKSGKELFYSSMLRKENTPSLCVNEQLDVWFDHGGANTSGIKGGNVIDFALAFWHPTTFKEALDKINQIMLLPTKIVSLNTDRKIRPRMKATRLANYKIQEIKELGNNHSIEQYLKKRGIWEQAQGKIKEIYYSIETGPKKGKTYFSAGWPNENEGWELRNKVGVFDFKSCLGRKGISVIDGDTNKLSMFEGFLDYLSWKKDNPNATDSIIVLNSVNLLDIAVKKARDFLNIDVYFDHDNAGDTAFKLIKKEIPHAIDCSHIYGNFKDYNEMLLARKNTRMPWEEDNIFEKILATYKR